MDGGKKFGSKKSSPPLSLNQFVALTSPLLDLEKEAEISASIGTSSSRSLDAAQKRGSAILNLKCTDAQTGLMGKTLLELQPNRGDILPAHKFGTHDVVVLKPNKADPGSASLGQGVVYRIKDSAITVAFDDIPEDGLNSPLRLEKVANEVTYRRMKDALIQLSKGVQKGPAVDLVPVLFGEKQPEILKKTFQLTPFNKNLDHSQKDAILKALMSKQVFLLHGPPGTGKTTTVVELILQEVKRGSKILACAASNIAVDNIVERLFPYRVKLVRLGHPARLLPQVLESALDAQVLRGDNSTLANDIRKEMRVLNGKLLKTKDRNTKRDIRKELKMLAKEEKKRQQLAVTDVIKNADVVLTTLLDATVAAFYGTGSKEERAAADQILRDLQSNPDTWLQVVHILQQSQNMNTKFFALQVLEGVIKYRWNALPVEQRDGMKNYISDVIVQLSSNEASFRRERLYVNKLNIILVQVLKHEWPARWKSFIPDLVSAARTSETLCENCMAILKLLSEEVFDFSRGEMTQLKIKELKQSLNSEFQLIHELCLYVLSASQRTELIRATLATLHAFLSWIPLGYIFESPLLETLLKFFPVTSYRNLTLQCLTEVAALKFGDFYDMQYVKMYTIFMVQLQTILPPGTNIPDAYANGSSEEQAFIQNLAMFFTSFFKAHICVLETTPENRTALLLGLEYLIGISYVDDTEVFKVCLDYWNILVLELFEAHHNLDNAQAPLISGIVDGLGSPIHQRRQLYAGPMSKLRMLMICRMAKPEEVLIVEDENGNIVRETLKDNDVLVQYKIMRETLIYLAHLGHEDTEQQMLTKLSKQLNGEDWSWNNLNTLCWAIGSISGSMMEDQENRFLVMVIRDLLNLCEITKGKDNKAVIASNIMYVVGQYPRFLRAHWKFLKTVVNKLFEFMHETHPGVQDMACDTFLKIVQKCKRKFVITQVGENEPFVSELLSSLPNTVADLEPHQIHTFYESVGHMIQAESEATKRDEYLKRLMELPNQRWAEIIGQASQSVDVLKEQEVIRTILNILQTNTSVASSLGTYFFPQISLIFLDMLTVYRMYSELISSSIAEGGPFASRTSFVKLLRSVKRETLKLIETFLDKAEDQPHIGKQFVPPMMDPVLGDYARNLPDARESEVLSLFATIINKYKAVMIEDVPRIFEAVFQCTLEMITKNFEDYPEHRLKFFSLLRAIATHCFQALYQLSSEQLKLVMDSIIWAFRHTERNIAETGLILLLEMLKNFQVSEFCNQFHKTYFLTIEQEIFAVLTDTFHKPGFKLHVLVLQHMFCLVDSGSLTEPLWDPASVPYPYPSNAAFVREYTIKLLGSSFPNMTAAEVTQFVSGLFDSRTDLSTFKDHIRDFLVQSKEFSAQDNKDLYAEEAAAQRERERQRMLSIPGLIAPSELHDEMVDS